MMKAMTSLLMGGILSGINLYLLAKILRGMTGSIQKKKLVVLVVAKLVILFGIISLILWKGHVTPLAFLAGFSVPLLGYICMNLIGSR